MNLAAGTCIPETCLQPLRCNCDGVEKDTDCTSTPYSKQYSYTPTSSSPLLHRHPNPPSHSPPHLQPAMPQSRAAMLYETDPTTVPTHSKSPTTQSYPKSAKPRYPRGVRHAPPKTALHENTNPTSYSIHCCAINCGQGFDTGKSK